MKKRKFIRIFIVAVLGLFFSVFVFCGWFYFSFRFQRPAAPSHGPVAVWARHFWAGAPHSEKEYDTFFSRLKKNRVTDVYFHVGPWTDARGGIPRSKYEYADELLAHARLLYPELRAHAWIGQMTVHAGGPLDLASERTRKNIVSTAAKFLDLGFDGVHYDFEPVYSGDAHFLALLADTAKITKKRGKMLSVAGGHLELIPGFIRLMRGVAPAASVWRRDYFLDVASHTDQIAVMLYDTGLPADWMFGSYVSAQTKRLVPLLCGKTELLIGIPTYSENRPGHRPWAENIQTGIRGARLGLRGRDARSGCGAGISIFAEWATGPAEWETFRREWLGKN